MKNKILFTLLIVLLIILGLGGCEIEGIFEQTPTVSSIIKLESGLAVRRQDPAEFNYLKVSENNVAVSTLFSPNKGEQIRWSVAGNKASDLFVFTGPINEREIEIEETLVRIDAKSKKVTEFEVGNIFGKIRFTKDDQYAILYHDSDDNNHGELFNPNEVAVVNLLQEPSETNPQIISIGIQGHNIESIYFLEPLDVNGVTRSLTVFASEGLVRIVDLADTSIGAITVKLKSDDDFRIIFPQKIVVRKADETHDSKIFILSSGAQEISEITLVAAIDETPGFWATLNQHDGGYKPTDLHIVEDNNKSLLVVINGSYGRINIIDIDTSDVFTINSNDSLNTIIKRTAADFSELVIYGSPSNNLYFLKIDDLDIQHGSNLEELYIPNGIGRVTRLDNDRLLIYSMYDDGLSIVDLNTRTITSLSSSGNYDWKDAHMWKETFFLARQGDYRINYLSLDNGHPLSLVLDEKISNFYVFDDMEIGLIIHPAKTGRATIFKLSDPSRQELIIVDGFWINKLLNTEVSK